ncbi:hypothetical protein [Ideonella sp. BN130291]|uniref:hypothetical protein n=1 Tax=Ideonella sp. BN130291 TaxID=3112940 RepID=UPI002E264908|nr:hypothetical protein [Ideonella sp. BN130291]
MAIDKQRLAQVATAFVEGMTSIRGRRVHRLILREMADCDVVVPASTALGARALLALRADGGVAVCQTDGSGRQATIQRLASLAGGAVVAAYDLHKDSLPMLAWTVWHPALVDAFGSLQVTVADVHADELGRVTEILARWR